MVALDTSGNLGLGTEGLEVQIVEEGTSVYGLETIKYIEEYLRSTNTYTQELTLTEKFNFYPVLTNNIVILLLLLLYLKICGNCCTILVLTMISEILNNFWSSKCINEYFDLADKTGRLVSCFATLLVIKSRAKPP